MIVVKLADIPENGLTVEDVISVKEMELTADDYIKFPEALRVKLRLQKFEDILLVRAHIEGKYTSYCSLSLQPLSGILSRDTDLSFDIDRNTETISLTEDLRQEILLDLPYKITYRDDFKELFKQYGMTVDVPEGLDLKDIPDFEEAQDDYKADEEPTHQPFLKLKDIE